MKIWSPTPTNSVVYDARRTDTAPMHYNHDSDIIAFKGRYICCWNANATDIYEGKPGQFNYSSCSDDFVKWSAPTKCFGSDGGAEPPQNEDTQWQPTFINLDDKQLFCNWQGYIDGKPAHFVSCSEDGLKWRNTIQPIAPDGFDDVYAFPTQHGLKTRRGTLMFPISLCHRTDFWQTRYAILLISTDQGKSWKWSKPIEAVTWSSVGVDPATRDGSDTIRLWEPTVFEKRDGRIGLLVRNLTKKDWSVKSEHTMLYAESSDEGMTWSKAVPVDIETVSSRVIADTDANGGLFVLANDWFANYPQFIEDRQFLTLFLSPVDDPDYLLPGPVVQVRGDIAHYPNGQITDNHFLYAYSFGNMPRYIHAGKIGPLPDFSSPFLMPRTRLAQPVLNGDPVVFSESHSSMALVLTKALTEQPALKIAFRVKPLNFCRYARRMPLLTIGAKNTNGLELFVGNEMKLYVRCTDGTQTEIGDVGYDFSKWLDIVIRIEPEYCSVEVKGVGSGRIRQKLLRKIAFGGLYTQPVAWPSGASFALDQHSIKVE